MYVADDTDDLEMYGSEATTPAGAHHISYSFEVRACTLFSEVWGSWSGFFPHWLAVAKAL